MNFIDENVDRKIHFVATSVMYQLALERLTLELVDLSSQTQIFRLKVIPVLWEGAL